MDSPAAVVNTFWWSVKTEFEVPIDRLPVALVNRPSRVVAGLMIVLGGAIVATLLWVGVQMAGEGRLTAAGPAIGLGVGLLLFGIPLVAGLNLWVKRTAITLDGTSVEWTTKSLFGQKRREEPVAGYEGVMYRKALQHGDNSNFVLDVLELVHPVTGNTVRLFKARFGGPVADRWVAYCRRFDRPAIENVTPTLRITRPLDELDSPLVELVRDGRVTIPAPSPIDPEFPTLGTHDRFEIQLSEDRRIVVTSTAVTELSVKVQQRAAMVARLKDVPEIAASVADGTLGSFGASWAIDQIESFEVEDDNQAKKQPELVMVVRQEVEGKDGLRIERKRLYLYKHKSVERCAWLQATLLRAVALGPKAVATPASGAWT